MGRQIKHLYIIHHSHTDIGYTDLQERVIYNQIHYLKHAIALIQKGYAEQNGDQHFCWNCETYYCVEQFLKQASKEEKADFIDLVYKGNLGISASYLNFNDLADTQVLRRRTAEMVQWFAEQGICVKTAMNADINGISMGARDALIDNGIEFLYTNIHTHHGMYPLYQNQTPYFWENESGKRLLVWNGEHYNLGNALGLVYQKNANYMMQTYFGDQQKICEPVEVLKRNLDRYLDECLESGYPYDFLITSVSGVFSDNAPPNTDIQRMVEAFHAAFGNDMQLEMVTLQTLYEKIREQVAQAPVYRGDLNDWWANGIGSTPYQVKHYKEAQRLYHLCNRLDEKAGIHNQDLIRMAEDNLLLYAEHTWGHSSTITDPYTTMVQNLDIRKTSYASKAHEASVLRLNELTHRLGDQLSYYHTSGRVKVIHPGRRPAKQPVAFFVETLRLSAVRVTDASSGKEMTVQLSRHPRGVQISFVDDFAAFEEKTYVYEELPASTNTANTRHAYMGAERVRDIVNTYDPVTYTLPYALENEWIKVCYEIGKGVTSLYDKKAGRELLLEGDCRFFTPIYENTAIHTDIYEERRKIGRNIRGLHATKCTGVLTKVTVLEQGSVFHSVELDYQMEGCIHSAVILKLYRDLPRLDFVYQIGKTIAQDIESIYLPLGLNAAESELWIDKGGVPMRPGVDQIPGTCMEYYMLEHGAAYVGKEGSVLIHSKDVPLVTMGELKHHPIRLCDNREENNHRPLYSWVMNNTWETNFKMDLSGFGEFCYSLEWSGSTDPKDCMEELADRDLGMVAFITG